MMCGRIQMRLQNDVVCQIRAFRPAPTPWLLITESRRLACRPYSQWQPRRLIHRCFFKTIKKEPMAKLKDHDLCFVRHHCNGQYQCFLNVAKSFPRRCRFDSCLELCTIRAYVYLDTVQDFFCNLGLKLHMHLAEISIFYQIITSSDLPKLLRTSVKQLHKFYFDVSSLTTSAFVKKKNSKVRHLKKFVKPMEVNETCIGFTNFLQMSHL